MDMISIILLAIIGSVFIFTILYIGWNTNSNYIRFSKFLYHIDCFFMSKYSGDEELERNCFCIKRNSSYYYLVCLKSSNGREYSSLGDVSVPLGSLRLIYGNYDWDAHLDKYYPLKPGENVPIVPRISLYCWVDSNSRKVGWYRGRVLFGCMFVYFDNLEKKKSNLYIEEQVKSIRGGL